MTDATAELAVQRIEVHVQVGADRMSGTDDPLFLGLLGRCGREFRLAFAKGRALKRGAADHFVLGPPGDPATNVAHPELNDPTSPRLDAAGIRRAYLIKGNEPIPNVRGVGELDDRLEVEEVSVEVFVAGQSAPLRFFRSGPLWLGLVCGLRFEIPRVDAHG